MGNASLTKPLAIIPARGGSKRFPRKNIALLNGKPLVAYAIEAALDSGIFDTVCISSDDDEILAVAADYRNVMPLKRPPELAGDKITNYAVCDYLIDYFAGEGKIFDAFGHLMVTNPLRTGKDVRAGWESFCASDADFLMSLGPYPHPPQWACRIADGYVERFFGDKYARRSQDLETLYLHNSAFVFARVDSFMELGDWYKGRVKAFTMPAERSVDIDHPLDLKWAEFLLQQETQDKTAAMVTREEK